jgi:ribokinase
MAEILVIGSSNTDMVIQAPYLPTAGETVLGYKFVMNPGGKGANQAVAAARLGGQVSFLGKLGEDLFGQQAIANLQREGINTDYLLVDPNHASGVALITVDKQGENTIVVASGANMALTEAEILQSQEAIAQAKLILLQLEIPLDTVELAVKIASELGKTIILNPAPAFPLTDSLLSRVTILTPNQTEAKILTGIEVDSPSTARLAAQQLYKRGVANVIITLGKEGAYLFNEQVAQLIPSHTVEAVDTTAAGDTFNGALAVALSEGQGIVDGVKFANLAAAVSVTRLGAQSSLPFRQEVEPSKLQ